VQRKAFFGALLCASQKVYVVTILFSDYCFCIENVALNIKLKCKNILVLYIFFFAFKMYFEIKPIIKKEKL